MKRFLVAAVFIIMLFTACSSESDIQRAAGAETETAGDDGAVYEKDENVLTLSMRTTTELNPLLNRDESVDSVLRLIFKPLISLDKDGRPHGEIAESWYYTQDGTSLTVKIKSGLKWHNGEDITARDVVYSINTIINSQDDTVYKKCAERILSATAADSNTVNISFSESYSGNIFAMCFPVIPESYYSAGGRSTEPMGSGPFKFADFTPAKELVLEACANSFSAEPYIKKVVVKMTTDSDTDIYSFCQKITDCVVADESDMGKYDFDFGTNKYAFNDNYYEFIGFNFNNEILQNKNVRKAIACCVPIDNIIESVYLSNAVKTSSPVNPSSFLYDTNVPAIRYDTDMAKEYLTTAGYVYDNDKNVFLKSNEDGSQSGIALKILVNSESKERRQTAVKVADELKTLGIAAQVETADYDTYMQKLQTGDFDMFVGGWKLSLCPYFGFMFSSANGSGYNYISYASEQMDTLLNAAYNAVSEADMIKAYSELEAYTAEELPYVSLLFRKSALFVNGRISGSFEPVPYDYYRNIESWTTGEALEDSDQ